ncbi:MAG: hypothetical protein IKS99_00345 [Firmicutes bacterium]|nr:hypothetical protein [Bacillota bacterium]
MNTLTLGRKICVLAIAFALIFTAFALPQKAEASTGIDVEIVSPTNNSAYILGKSVSIQVKPDLYINGINNYVQVRVLRSNKVVFSKNIRYTDLSTVSCSYTPDKAGTYTLKAGFSPNDQSDMYDETPSKVTFTVTDITKEIKDMKPTISVFRFATDYAEITWKEVDGLKLKIYRATKKDGNYKLIKTAKGNYYADENITGKTYYYKARWYIKQDGKNYYSKYSSIKKSTTKGIPQIKSLKYVEGKGVKITWTESSFADEYYVFRTDNGFSKSVKKGKTYVYDKTVKKGKKYTYEVKAYNEKKQRGKASDEKSIKIPK